MRNGVREGTGGEGKYIVDSYEEPRSQMMWTSKIFALCSCHWLGTS